MDVSGVTDERLTSVGHFEKKRSVVDLSQVSNSRPTRLTIFVYIDANDVTIKFPQKANAQ